MLHIRDISIVGTIHTPNGILAAQKAASLVDKVEFRADILPKLANSPSLKKLPQPLIWTVRDASEGGVGNRSFREREELYVAGMEVASFLDVELASVKKMKSVLQKARTCRLRLILSFHDFENTPSAASLKSILRRAEDAGADIVKFATTVDSSEALCRLLRIFEFAGKTPVAAMGMGRFGKVSRLICAQAGSVLNYAWLHRPQIIGQWSAKDLRARFLDLNISGKKRRH